jgi:hypothetical protein
MLTRLRDSDYLPSAALILVMAVTFMSLLLVAPHTSAQNAYVNSWVYQEAVETTYLPPAKFLSVTLQHPPGLTAAGGTVYPVKVSLNGTLLPGQPTKVWALGGATLLVIVPNVPPVDPIAISGQAPATRIDVDYWWGQ